MANWFEVKYFFVLFFVAASFQFVLTEISAQRRQFSLHTKISKINSFHPRPIRSLAYAAPPVFTLSCTCGMKSVDQVKIVGGQLAGENSWPWVVPLIQVINDTKVMQFCGASLINNQYLLTASHCVMDIKVENLRLYQALLGTNSISNPNATRAAISEIKMHPNFNRKTLENDIALIKLSQPVLFSSQVRPICLKQDGSPFIGVAGTVAGWGSLRKGGNGVDRLREVKVRVIRNSQCVKSYSIAKIKIGGQMMCAGFPAKDSCQGDSGGPFFLRNFNAKVFTQIGIVSFGLDCGNPAFPGVYTRIAPYMRWLQNNTSDAIYCQKSF